MSTLIIINKDTFGIYCPWCKRYIECPKYGNYSNLVDICCSFILCSDIRNILSNNVTDDSCHEELTFIPMMIYCSQNRLTPMIGKQFITCYKISIINVKSIEVSKYEDNDEKGKMEFIKVDNLKISKERGNHFNGNCNKCHQRYENELVKLVKEY